MTLLKTSCIKLRFLSEVLEYLLNRKYSNLIKATLLSSIRLSPRKRLKITQIMSIAMEVATVVLTMDEGSRASLTKSASSNEKI